MAVIKVDDLNIGYREQGRGESIVFLHGVGSDKALWDGQVAYFSESRRAVAIDYPGYGESDLPDRDLGREEIARYVSGALERLGISAAHIVGLSMGGIIALEMICREPARVVSLTLADTFAKHHDGKGVLERAHKAIETMTMREFAEARMSAVLSPHASEEIKREAVENMARIDKRSYGWAASAVWTGDYLAELSNIAVPTLVVVGEHDRLTPLSLAQQLESGIRGACLEVIPDAGHISNFENPDGFNKALEAFLSATGRVSDKLCKRV